MAEQHEHTHDHDHDHDHEAESAEQAPVKVIGEEPDLSKGTARPITVVGNPVLHRECKIVTAFDEELSALIDDMFVSMYAAAGVGLAANQIGVDAKVFVYDCPDDNNVRHIGHIINRCWRTSRSTGGPWTTATRAACRCPPPTPSCPAPTSRR